jgi:uncharacterized membrane protein
MLIKVLGCVFYALNLHCNKDSVIVCYLVGSCLNTLGVPHAQLCVLF